MALPEKSRIKRMSELILALNAGSSSLKFGLFSLDEGTHIAQIMRASYENLAGKPHFSAKDPTGRIIADEVFGGPAELPRIVEHLVNWLSRQHDPHSFVVAGHRIVHGGQGFVAPVRLHESVIKTLEALSPLAPLHQPGSLAPIRALQRLWPDLPQYGCFDTAFHHGLQPPFSRYAIPGSYEKDGIRKYGFHGLSYEYIADRIGEISPELFKKRTVVAHLGSGCSLCAIRDGVSVDTTMGLTPLDGLVMGTRSGSIDPGIILHLLRERGMTIDEVEQLLYRQSGLLGVSGISADVRDLLASDQLEASAAIELFVFRIAREIAAMAASLQGLDVLVFTGGIGEHSPQIRELICSRLKWLNVDLSTSSNDANATVLSAQDSTVEILMFPANEELAIARNLVRSGLAVRP